jgi:hypothetical protein
LIYLKGRGGIILASAIRTGVAGKWKKTNNLTPYSRQCETSAGSVNGNLLPLRPYRQPRLRFLRPMHSLHVYKRQELFPPCVLFNLPSPTPGILQARPQRRTPYGYKTSVSSSDYSSVRLSDRFLIQLNVYFDF